ATVAVLFYALGFLGQRRFWLDTENDPEDEITDDDWDVIETLVSNAYRDIMSSEIGSVIPYFTTDPPPNTLVCDGASYNRVDFPILYALLDSAFIIDADTFFVPDMRGRAFIGVGTGSGLSTYAMGDTGGEESHTLTTTEMPSHSHTDTGHIHTEGTT